MIIFMTVMSITKSTWTDLQLTGVRDGYSWTQSAWQRNETMFGDGL